MKLKQFDKVSVYQRGIGTVIAISNNGDALIRFHTKGKFKTERFKMDELEKIGEKV